MSASKPSLDIHSLRLATCLANIRPDKEATPALYTQWYEIVQQLGSLRATGQRFPTRYQRQFTIRCGADK